MRIPPKAGARSGPKAAVDSGAKRGIIPAITGAPRFSRSASDALVPLRSVLLSPHPSSGAVGADVLTALIFLTDPPLISIR